MKSIIEVPIHTDTIKLGQLLKLANAVQGGGEAKVRIQNGEVRLNGVVETQRGKQVREGDLIEIAGIAIKVRSPS